MSIKATQLKKYVKPLVHECKNIIFVVPAQEYTGLDERVYSLKKLSDCYGIGEGIEATRVDYTHCPYCGLNLIDVGM